MNDRLGWRGQPQKRKAPFAGGAARGAGGWPGGDGRRGGSGERGWDPVAGWYDKLVGDGGSDYHRNVIVPALVAHLTLPPGARVLDLCCGQGVLAPVLGRAGAAEVTGVDASPRLIEAARQRHGRRGVHFVVGDATMPGAWAEPAHDAAVCVLALHDVADLDGLLGAMAVAVKPGGMAHLVLMHPCFRIPRQSHWGWDDDHKIQYRRLDCYASPLEIPVATHPGRRDGLTTQFHHRPVAAYLGALGRAGFGVTGADELMSHRRSQPGPRSRAEHRAAREFPLFLYLRATKLLIP